MLTFCASMAFLQLTSWGQVPENTDAIIGKLSAENEEARFEAQMQLQEIASNSSRPGAELERIALATHLAAKATDPSLPKTTRSWLIRQLEYIGSTESIPALTSLLEDRDLELKESARRALEKNNAPESSESLRAALEKAVDPVWIKGLVHALGEKKDSEAVNLISGHLENKNTFEAAALALSQIADGVAMRKLQRASRQNPDAVMFMLNAADVMQARGDAGASGIYRRVFTGNYGPQYKASALAGLAMTHSRQTLGMISQAFKFSDIHLLQTAVNSLSYVEPKRKKQYLNRQLQNLPSRARRMIVSSLDANYENLIIQLSESDPDSSVRQSALESLGEVGSADSVPALLKAAAKKNGEESAAAESSLTRISGDSVDSSLLATAADGTPELRSVAINALAARHDEKALSVFLEAAKASDATVKSAALNALTEIGSETEVKGLSDLYQNTQSSQVLAALKAVAGRVENQSAVVEFLTGEIATAEAKAQGAFVEVIGAVGGKSALKTVVDFSGSQSKDIRDRSIRTLCDWKEFTAAKPLLTIARDSEAERVHRILAVRGIARLVRNSTEAKPENRVEFALAAITAATRPEEKKQALSALGAVAHRSAANAIKSFAKNPELRDEAGLAAISLAKSLFRSDRETANDLMTWVREGDFSDTVKSNAQQREGRGRRR